MLLFFPHFLELLKVIAAVVSEPGRRQQSEKLEEGVVLESQSKRTHKYMPKPVAAQAKP